MSWMNDMAGMMQGSPSGVSIKIGVMTGANTCKLGNLELTKDDLKFMDGLLQDRAVKVSGTCPADGGALVDTSTYSLALKAGDEVALYQLSDSRFLVLGRTVNA